MIERQPLQQITLALLLIWALISQAVYSGFLIRLEMNAGRSAQAPFYTQLFSPEISEVPLEYRETGLRAGDRVVELNGVPVYGEERLDQARLNSIPGQTLNILVERPTESGKRLLNILVLLKPRRTQWTRVLVLSFLLPISCLLIGFYIAFARPRDPLAWIAMAMLASFGQVAGSGVSWVLASPWRELLFVYHAVLANSWPLWLMLFALYFPVPFPGWKKYKFLNWVFGLPSIILGVLLTYGYLRAGSHFAELGWLAEFIRKTESIFTVIFTGYVFAFFFLLGSKKRFVVQTPDAKRRLNVMLWGCAAALTPLLPVVFLDLPVWLTTLCMLMVVFFPITMAYVIVVQRAMDVRMVVRSGVRYALAANSIKVIRVVLITALVIVTIKLEQQSSHRWEGILIAAVGVVLIVMVGRLARWLSLWIDRRFFREAYNAELMLTELGNSVASIRDVKTLLQTVARRIASTMHVDKIAVLLERESRYEPAYALGVENAISKFVLGRDAATVRVLKQAQSPSKIYFDDPQSWIYGAPEPEQQILRTLGAQVLLPVSLNSRLLGVISLGAKRSELPYSQADLHLLNAVATQTGLALENAALSDTIRKEIAARERLDRELEIAREVQQHLFPQRLPRVEGLDFAGYCRPAEGVGGDYYDFVRLPDDRLGIAIGDVSGKGISAALLMASLQASLRGQTIKPCDTLAEMIGNINRLVYDASADNRYATFFYAEYNPHTRLLRYVNAGHNPPIVLRKNRNAAARITRLDKGGLVIGFFPDSSFEEGFLTLERSDVLVAFTDGISEAMNSREEEFEERRLLNVLEEHEARTAADLISEVLERVDRFAAGARQHDDMTLVVLRVQ